jgi:hypothetical protein
LSDRFEKHLLGCLVGFESLITLRQEHGDGRSFWKLGLQQLHPTIDDSTRSDSHSFILTERLYADLNRRFHG